MEPRTLRFRPCRANIHDANAGASNALPRHQSRAVRHHHRHRLGSGAPTLGALIVSLPLVSILGILWLWHYTGDAQRIATHAQSTFWYVLPTLPMFLVMPAMLRGGVNFWLTLAACCALTFVLYLATIWLLEKFGVAL
jgi:hypothetical protein